MSDILIKEMLTHAKTIAMVGVSATKEKEDSKNIVRRPSTIVMKYMQEFGYEVIPINPFSVGKKIYGQDVLGKLEDIKKKVDIVNIFRPSKETPEIAKQAAKIGAKVIWLQFGIDHEDAKQIAKESNIEYVSNKCIKQEYQRLFLKTNPVFPVLKN
jgi:predicted CoA-binding protein